MGHYPCCCGCPRIFDTYPHPAGVQVDIVGNGADNPQQVIYQSGLFTWNKEELTFDDFDLSAVLSLGGTCDSPTGSLGSACEPPDPLVGCCARYGSSVIWTDSRIEHKQYLAGSSGGPWGYNAGGSYLKTVDCYPEIDLQIFRYDDGHWYAVVKAFLRYYAQATSYVTIKYALMWRGCAEIATDVLSPGTYDVPLDLSCAPSNGDDGSNSSWVGFTSPTMGTPPVAWSTGVTAAGTATITVF